MCQFFSAIYTRTGELLWHWCTDHHSDLMRIFKLKDEQEQHFVRVEFTPPEDLSTIVDVDTWKFRLDEERTPGWFDAEAKGAAITKLKGVIGSHIVTDARDVLTDGPWVLADGANVNTILSGRIALMCASSNVGVMWESSKVGVMRESSKVVVMRESSKVGEMRESSKVGVMRESSKVGEMRESSKVGVMWESSKVGVMWESSKVGVMWGSSNVGVMRESSKVGVMRGSSKVGVMRGSSKVEKDKREKAQLD